MKGRRFARCFEFDRNPDLEGDSGQRLAIRNLLANVAPHGSRLDDVLFKVDRAVNRKGRHYIPISFVDFTALGLLGFTFPTVMQLHYQLDPEWIGGIFLHELGHVVGWHGLATVDTSERWADQFHRWVENGQPDDDVWERMR